MGLIDRVTQLLRPALAAAPAPVAAKQAEIPGQKASGAGPVIAWSSLGQPLWTPRNYESLAREGSATGTSGYSDGHRLLRTIFANGSPYAGIVIYAGNSAPNSGYLISSDGAININGGADGNGFQGYGLTTGNSGNVGLGNINKVAFRANGGSAAICLNGGAITATTTSTALGAQSSGITHAGIGNNGSGSGPGPLNGYIMRIALWDREITDGQMIEWTR